MNAQPVSHHAHELPDPRKYVELAVILGIFTIVETATYYIHISELVITLALIVFMTCKFGIVVGYYMHLKFEHRLLLSIFAFGLAVALSIMLAMIAIYANY